MRAPVDTPFSRLNFIFFLSLSSFAALVSIHLLQTVISAALESPMWPECRKDSQVIHLLRINQGAKLIIAARSRACNEPLGDLSISRVYIYNTQSLDGRESRSATRSAPLQGSAGAGFYYCLIFQ